MRKILLYVPVLAMVLALGIGCEKATTLLPPREVSEEVQIIADRYSTILTGTDKWLLAYKPETYDDSIYIQLQFSEGGLVDILSGYRGFHTEQNETVYDFEGKYIPIIAFAENTVFGALADLYNGSAKFKINYIEDKSYFELVRSDGYDDNTFRLIKMNANNEGKLIDQINEVLDEIAFEEEQARLSEETRLKMKAFGEIESDIYFYNLKVEDFSARIDVLDTTNKALSLTYKETPLSAATSVTVNYSIYPGGIALTPAIGYADVLIDSVQLGEMDGDALEIVKAGNAGSGAMGYMHEAPYAYTLTTDRAVSTADWLLDPAQLRGLLLYTAHTDEYYSDLVNQERAAFGTYLDNNVPDVKSSTRLVNQIYLPSGSSANIQISTHRQSAAGNLFFLYRFDLEKIQTGYSALHIVLTEPATNVLPHKDAFDEYLNSQFPEEGVTVVPTIVGTTLRFRLVSLKDSRYWVEYVLNAVADRSLRFD